MRLIDADELKGKIENAVKKQKGKDYDLVKISEIPILIDMQKTAYDVDKVVEKLEELTRQAEKDTNYHFDNSSNYPCKYDLADMQERRYEVLCEVLKIVKEGWVNENW